MDFDFGLDKPPEFPSCKALRSYELAALYFNDECRVFDNTWLEVYLNSDCNVVCKLTLQLYFPSAKTTAELASAILDDNFLGLLKKVDMACASGEYASVNRYDLVSKVLVALDCYKPMREEEQLAKEMLLAEDISYAVWDLARTLAFIEPDFLAKEQPRHTKQQLMDMARHELKESGLDQDDWTLVMEKLCDMITRLIHSPLKYDSQSVS